MSVALQYLIGYGSWFQAKPAAGNHFNFRHDCSICAYSPGYLAYVDIILCLDQSFEIPFHFLRPQSHFKAEGDRLGMYAVSSADHQSILMLNGLIFQYLDQFG